MNNRQVNSTQKMTALYSRLSKDDEKFGDSVSILNQKAILEDYALKNGFVNICHFQDDGVSGTTFDRRGWNDMIAEVEAGNVGAVITKDLSRIGRDYLKVGFYTEVMFREKDVRFIAISNNIDSATGENEFAPFMNIMSEWYARDTSRKIKTVLHSKGRSGKHMTNSPIYGYKKSLEDKNKWLIDEEPAAIVRQIFQMTIDGKGPYQIARTLTDEKILRPTAYIALRDGYDMPNPGDKYNWGGQSVKNILDKPEYMGHTINFRTYKESYKDKKCKRRPKEEWTVFEGTQDPIIDETTWESAQKCRVVKRRANSTGEPNPLTGLTYCADCGGKMYNHIGSSAQYDSQNSYACNQYTKYPPKCTMHYIKTSVLRTLVLETIQSVSSYVKENEAEFIRLVRKSAELQSEEAAKLQKKQLAKSQKRCSELNTLIKRLYEDKVSGELSAKRFEILSNEYEQEQEDLERQIIELQSELERFNADGGKADKFIEIVRRYTDFPELNATVLNEFVDKIVVHEADKSTGRREQQVDIYLNFIGKFSVPGQITESEPFDPVEHRREQWRNHYYRNRDKILAEKSERREQEKAEKLAAQPIKTPEEIVAEETAKREKKKEYQREYQRKWQRKKREQKNMPLETEPA